MGLLKKCPKAEGWKPLNAAACLLLIYGQKENKKFPVRVICEKSIPEPLEKNKAIYSLSIRHVLPRQATWLWTGWYSVIKCRYHNGPHQTGVKYPYALEHFFLQFHDRLNFFYLTLIINFPIVSKKYIGKGQDNWLKTSSTIYPPIFRGLSFSLLWQPIWAGWSSVSRPAPTRWSP